jgi:hypothetical protein
MKFALGSVRLRRMGKEGKGKRKAPEGNERRGCSLTASEKEIAAARVEWMTVR